MYFFLLPFQLKGNFRFRSQRSYLRNIPFIICLYFKRTWIFGKVKLISNIIIIPFFIIYIPQYLSVTSAVYDHLLLVWPPYWKYSIYYTCGYRTDEWENFFDTSSWHSKLQYDKRVPFLYYSRENYKEPERETANLLFDRKALSSILWPGSHS